MDKSELTIGQRVRKARKEKGYSQTELATVLSKSLRTIQKYENGEIEISLSMINELAKALDTTSTYLLGYKIEKEKAEITSFADILGMLFELEKVTELKFDIDAKRPPRNDNWECSLKFEGKAKTELNADMCLFLEDWAAMRKKNPEKYEEWKDKTLAYYSKLSVSAQPRKQLDDNTLTRKVVPSIGLQDI